MPGSVSIPRCACGYSVMACEATKAGGLHEVRMFRKANPPLERFGVSIQ